MKTLVLSDVTALEKAEDSAEPYREPHVIILTRVICMIVVFALVNMRDSTSHSA